MAASRAYAGAMGTNPGVLQRAVTRLASSAKEHEAQELQKDCVQMGAVPVSELPDRELVRVAGTLRTVTLRPRAGVPALVAELYDGSGSISLVWLGRQADRGNRAGPGADRVRAGHPRPRAAGHLQPALRAATGRSRVSDSHPPEPALATEVDAATVEEVVRHRLSSGARRPPRHGSRAPSLPSASPSRS